MIKDPMGTPSLKTLGVPWGPHGFPMGWGAHGLANERMPAVLLLRVYQTGFQGPHGSPCGPLGSPWLMGSPTDNSNRNNHNNKHHQQKHKQRYCPIVWVLTLGYFDRFQVPYGTVW